MLFALDNLGPSLDLCPSNGKRKRLFAPVTILR